MSIWANDFSFKHLDIADGLSNKHVNAIFKDSKGFVWFGTASGLDRFDGYNIRPFSMNPSDVKSLPDNYVSSIQESEEGDIWVNTGLGYALYNSQTEDFDRDIRHRVWEYGLEAMPTLVHIDSNKNFWFYVEGTGCYWYKKDQKLLYPFLQGEGDDKLPEGKIVSIVDCNEGALVVFNDGRLVCLSGDKRQVVWREDYIAKRANIIDNNYSAFVDKDENLWVFGTSTLWIYNRAIGKWMTSLADFLAQTGIRDAAPRLEGTVTSVSQDNDGNIWIGTGRSGLVVIDRNNKRLYTLTASETDKRSMHTNSIQTLYKDDTGSMWIGTQRKGVSYYNKSLFKFNLNYVGDVTSICEDKGRGCLWIGTNGDGLFRRDSATGTITKVTVPGAAAYEGEVINKVFVASDGTIYIATYRKGLDTFDGLRFNHLSFADTMGNITSVVEDTEGYIWIGFMGSGLRRYDKTNGKTVAVTVSSHQLVSDYVTDLAIGRDGKILVGSIEGIAVVSPDVFQVSNYTGLKGGEQEFSNTYVNQLFQDVDGNIWIGTRSGLNIFNPESDHLSVINQQNGLSNNVVYGIAEDHNHNLWVTTAKGLSNLVVQNAANGGSNQIFNYDSSDGLQEYELNERAICSTSLGEIVLGGLNGINVFNPDSIQFDQTSPKVIFTGLLVDDESVVVGRKYGKRVILEEIIGTAERIRLNSDVSNFEIQVATDNYNVPEKIRLQYKLEGWDKEWVFSKMGDHTIHYAGLPTGTYVLHVLAINGDGFVGKEERVLTIEIDSHWWETWWAYVLYVLLAAALLELLRRLACKHERAKVLRELAEGKLQVEGIKLTSDADEKDAASLSPDNLENYTSPEETDEMATVPESERHSVLFVDDTEDFRLFMVEKLSNIYTIIEKTSAAEAWAYLDSAETMPEVIICDMDMAEMDGNELCNLVKADNRTEKIPFVMMMNANTDKEQLRNQLFEADEYIEKPFNIKTLCARVNKLLKWYRNESTEIFEYKNADMVLADATMDEEDNALFQKAMDYVNDNMSRPDLTVGDISYSLGIERPKLYKLIQTVSGKSPAEFIRGMRLKRAVQLLQEGGTDPETVAQEVGFNNVMLFSKYFKEEFGVMPSQFK